MKEEYSRYGLLDYKAGLQKVFNICKADPNITVVAYYRMGGAGPGIPDLSGNGLDLTESGTPTYQQPDYLGLNRAILFNPTNHDYFYHSDHALFNIGTADFIIWDIFKTTNATDNISLMHKRVAGAEGFVLYKRDSAGAPANKLEFVLSDNVPTLKSITSNSAVNDGNYHLVEIAADRSANCIMFIDSVAQTDVENISAIGSISSTQQYCIGRNSAVANMYYDGSRAETLIIKATSGTLPDWVMSPAFALNAHNWAMKWPTTLPH